jgi:hypothetical protein
VDLSLVDGKALVDAVRRLEVLSRKIHSAGLEIVHEIDRRGIAGELGCSNTAALLREVLRLSPSGAAKRVKDANALQPWLSPTGARVPAELPETAAALRAGELSPEHVQVVRDVVRKLPDEIRDQARDGVERALVEESRRFDPTVVARIGVHLLNALDPDGTLQDELESRRRRELTFRESTNGMIDVRGRLDKDGAATVQAALSPLTKPRDAEDRRPGPRRLADALVELARHALDAGRLPTEGGEKPHLTVTVRLHDLIAGTGVAHTDWQGPIPIGALAEHLCDCKVTRVVLGAHGEPLDVGRTRYLVRGPLRRALIARDRGCAQPGCRRPPQWCSAHHIKSWISEDGDTAIENLVLLCHYHHAQIHERQWSVRMVNGIPEFIPPAWLDPLQRPQRNTYHHAA